MLLMTGVHLYFHFNVLLQAVKRIFNLNLSQALSKLADCPIYSKT